jgi:hypothetical protein
VAEVNCEVRLPQGTAVDFTANAFRLVQDSSQEWFLDFLQYAETTESAAVVARVRVPEPLLKIIRERLGETLGGELSLYQVGLLRQGLN